MRIYIVKKDNSNRRDEMRELILATELGATLTGGFAERRDGWVEAANKPARSEGGKTGRFKENCPIWGDKAKRKIGVNSV